MGTEGHRRDPDADGEEPTRDEVVRAIDALVDERRVECLWWMRRDYRPRTDRERICALEAIQARSGLDVFKRAGKLKAWLSRHSSDASARVNDGSAAEFVDWVQDSAYRFFPLVEHETFGLTLHPFDLATNKVLALAGRREPRDWVDAIHCHEALQPLGYLAWAASGKDPGLSPLYILEEAARTRYAQVELAGLDFEGDAPSAASLSRRWHAAVDEARELVRLLPAEHAGKCVLDLEGRLLRATPGALEAELAAGRVRFHEGRVKGAFPELRGPARE